VGDAPRTIAERRLGWYDPASGVNALLLNLAAQVVGRFPIRARAMQGIQSWADMEAAPASPTSRWPRGVQAHTRSRAPAFTPSCQKSPTVHVTVPASLRHNGAGSLTSSSQNSPSDHDASEMDEGGEVGQLPSGSQ
jgi:hypothetical protein